MPTEGKDYDVFLSHNSADKPDVEALARRLEDEAHLTPFLDKWHLVPGNPWQEELERALDHSDTCAVFIGPTGIGPWHNEEMRSALDEQVKHPGFRVVPVLLPGSTLPERGQLPRFLRRLTWVDFRGPKGLNDAGAFQRLVAGIRGVPPGRDATGTLGVLMTECPYRGLEAFDEAHARFFFGREAEIQHLLEAFRTASFLAVIGPSGSGKSSLVRAGLLPQLQAGAVPQSAQWHYSILKPGVHPLEELAVSLAQLTRRTDVQSLLESLEAHERALHWQIRLLLSGQSEYKRVCFVIDQFEEVFTLCEDQTEQQCFINALRYAATVVGGQTMVVLTLRADFVPRAAEYPPLAELLSNHQFLISQMDGEDLRRVIEEPARLVGVTLAPGLTEQMLQDAGREPGILPLLEHALLQLWQKRRSDNVLTLAAYREIGGVHGALAQRAEEIFAGFSPEQQVIARRILLRLTQPGESTEDTRRRATLSELQTWGDTEQAVQQVVEKLADARLLVTSEEQVDVAHEALIRGWPRLRRWIDEDRSALRTHRRITEAAQEWQRLHRDEGALFQGIPLAQAQEWQEGHEGELNALEREFLNTSVALKQRTEAEENTRRQRELEQAQVIAAERVKANKRLWWGIRVLCTLMLIVLGVAGYAYLQQKRAEQQTALALSRGLAAEARNYLNKQLDLALLLSVEANRQAKTAEARQALYTALDAAGSSIFLHGYWDELRELAFSPNGKTLASGGIRGTLLLWDLSKTPPPSRLFSGFQEPVRAFTFNPDSTMLVSGDQEGTLLLLDLSVTPPMSILLPHDQRHARPLTFSPDGKTLATGGNGGPILWNLDFEAWPNHACRIANRNLTCAEWAQFIKDEPYRPTCENLALDQCQDSSTSKIILE